MKKYIAAAVVALMVFAFAAFAASFTVEDSVLAAGQGDVTSCTDTVQIVSWGAESDDNTIGNVSVWLHEDCWDSDLVMFANIDGSRTNEHQLPDGCPGPIDVDGTCEARITLSFTHANAHPGNRIPIEDIDDINFLIHTKTG